MKTTVLFLSLFLLNTALSQSDKYKVVPGTKLSLIPPKGFEPVSNFNGFQNTSNGASIMLIELPAPYNTIVTSFTADGLKNKGMTLIEKKEVIHQGAKATFFKVSQPANGITYLKQMLLFGDDTKTVMVNGIYPEQSKAIEEDLRISLMSTLYNESQSASPEETAPFKIDVSGTDFKFSKSLTGSLLYSTDGNIPTNGPFLMVGSSFSKVPAGNHKQYSLERLKKLPGGDAVVVREVKDIEIGGLKGYEIVADSKTKEGRPELIYQVMLYDAAGDYFIFVGAAKEEFEKRLQDFKYVAKTFKRKL